MTLYHGSDQIIKSPELRASIRTLDFGPGFYTTTNKKQAKNFAIKVYNRSIRTGKLPEGKFLSIYEIDYDIMQKELAVLYFASASEAWFDFIIANRRSTWQANDTIYRTLIVFETGELSKSETIARLKIRELFDQMTFVTERSLSFLKYSGFEEASNV